jgi:dynactin complex subunit
MLSILKSTRFQTEYKTFQEKINSISNENLKNELNELLGKLYNAVKNIDLQHQDMYARTQINMAIPDTKLEVSEIRLTIDRKLKDWEQAQQR